MQCRFISDHKKNQACKSHLEPVYMYNVSLQVLLQTLSQALVF